MNVKDKSRGKKTTAEGSPQLVFALSHRLRRQILRLMLALPQGGTISPVELARALDRPISNISYHVRVLAEKGAVVMVNTRQVRGSVEHFYQPSDALLDTSWVSKALHETKLGD